MQAFLAAGRSVVAACRSAPDLGMKAGEQDNGAILFIEKGVDVTKANSIKTGLFKGVTQARYSRGLQHASLLGHIYNCSVLAACVMHIFHGDSDCAASNVN